jgi:hypothetical protein
MVNKAAGAVLQVAQSNGDRPGALRKKAASCGIDATECALFPLCIFVTVVRVSTLMTDRTGVQGDAAEPLPPVDAFPNSVYRVTVL